MTDRTFIAAPSLQVRHRLSAIGALLVLPTALVCLAVGIVLGMPYMLVPIAFALPTAWLAWHSLTRRGLRRRVYAVAAVLCGLIVLAGVVWGGVQLPLLSISMVLLILGAALTSWALSWVYQPAGRLVGRAHHPVLIVNPRSGDGAAERHGLIEEAEKRGIKVIELGPDDDLVQLARHAVRRGADCIGVAGGDGSLAIVAEVAIRHSIPFVCVPAGTRNHFALDLGLDRSDPVAALDAFGEAVQRRIDVATVNDRMFLNNVSIGAYGEVVASEEYRDNKMGVTLDRIPGLIGPDAERLDLRFTDVDGMSHDSAVVIHVSNNRYSLRVMGLGSRPSLDDGELGIVLVVHTNDNKPLSVIQWQSPTFRVESGATIGTGVDGESIILEPPLQFAIRPHALRIRTPRGVAGVSPAARRPPLTLRTVRRLVDVASGVPPRPEIVGR